MRFDNEFTVDAELDAAWPVLLDLPRVARCLPGATIAPDAQADVYRGRMKVKLGPITSDYAGTVRILSVDEDEREVVVEVDGHDAKGQGMASATITNRLRSEGSRTHVSVVTDLTMSGAHAQLGRGVMESVANAMLAQFAERLAAEIAAPAGAASAAADADDSAVSGPPASGSAASRGTVPPADEDDVLDVGGAAWAALPGVARLPLVGGIAGVLLLLVLALRPRGRRRGVTLTIHW